MKLGTYRYEGNHLLDRNHANKSMWHKISLPACLFVCLTFVCLLEFGAILINLHQVLVSLGNLEVLFLKRLLHG